MKATIVADLLDIGRVSTDRLDAALKIGAPVALAWCSRPGAAVGRVALRDALLRVLPEALHTGLPECILRRWLPRQPVTHVDAPADVCIAFELQPEVDLLYEGLPAFALSVRACVALEQRGSGWHCDGVSARIGAPRAWHASLSLQVGDARWPVNGLPFHENRLDIFLPAGPWPR